MLFTSTATKGQFPFSRRSEEIRLVVIYQKVTTAGNRHNYLKHLLGVLFFRSLLVCETIVLPGKCNAPDKKRRISQISLMTERRIMTLLGKKLQKKGKRPEVISSIMAKLEMTKNIHLFSIWYPFGYTYSGNVYLSCLVKTKT